MCFRYKISLLFSIFSICFSQYGQNIVQYDDFKWHYIQTEHFDIYYYNEGKKHAEFTAIESEIAYSNIANALNWHLKSRVSIIVYNSHNDFQQTNVIDSYMYEGIGGVTELYKNRVVIPFDASNKEFMHVIHHELVHAFINDCVYGGNLRKMIANSVKVQIPMWMNEGLAEYLASGWDTNSEMWIRDLAINQGEFPEIKSLNGYMAYRGGQSVWNFITSKWGEESIAEIINQIKQSGNVDKGIKNALRVDYKTLNKQWHQYLKETYWPDVTIRKNINDISKQLTNHIELKNTYNVAPAISPDGSKIAMYSNKSGPMAIYLISSENGKFLEKIVQGERNSEFEELHILKPGISWSPNGKRIVFAAKSGRSDALFVINIENGKKTKYRLNMEGIFRPSWRPNHNEIAFIGNNGKNSDIYLFNLDNEELKNLTNDWFTDDQISWNSNGNELLFISDRGNILTTGTQEQPLNHNFHQTDIYSLDLISSSINRITETDFNETYPIISSQGNHLFYISDENGINNIYVRSGENINSIPITNIITGITQLSWNNDNSQLIFTGFYNGGYDIYVLDNPISLIRDDIIVPKAEWITDNKHIKRISNKEKNTFTHVTENKYKNYVFSNIASKTKDKNITLDEQEYFDSSGSYISHKYKTRFTLDFAQAYYAFDSRFGGQGMANFLFSDILGNHKMQIGTEMVINLKRSDYFFVYRLLPYKIDWNFIFYHLAYEYAYSSSGVDNIYMPSQNIKLLQDLGLSIEASKPLSRFNRLEAGIDLDYIVESQLELGEKNIYGEYEYTEKYLASFVTAIPSIKYVWDNAMWSFTHPVEGARYYVKYRSSPGINKKSLIFHSATVDARKYYRLFNHISFAGRLFYGANWGENAQKFRLGGVPWIFSSDSYTSYYNSESITAEELYFSEYVMPVRGSTISQKLGQNVLLINLELRLPFLVYYFPTLRYLGQINGVIFTDLGVTWEDEYLPYSKESNWEAGSTGWLMSYGLGPRFFFFGIPWKLDFAWEYNPHIGTISKRKWFLSMGLDF